MKVDQNPLAEDPNQGVAQCYPVVGSEKQITEACELSRFRLQNKEVSGRPEKKMETANLGDTFI